MNNIFADPPVIFPDPDSGGKDIELMHGFALTCDVVGNPLPKVKWYFQVSSHQRLLLLRKFLYLF